MNYMKFQTLYVELLISIDYRKVIQITHKGPTVYFQMLLPKT